MSLDERLGDLLTHAADDALLATRTGVQSAIDRRRRRRRSVGTAIAAACLVAGVGGGLALAGTGDDASDGADLAGPVDDLPLVGIDLVGFNRAPELDPQPDPSGPDLTYAAFTADDPDVLGPMITASLQAEADQVGGPIDLDLDGIDTGPADGHMITFPDGAGITWSVGDQVASINGHGVPIEDVVVYAEELSGVPFDLEQMPAPERLPNREVVTFEPEPDYPFRVATYQGPGVVASVLTTSDPGYFDLTRIVSTEGTPYERIGFESTFLGPGEAILSPDDDGPASALVRTEAGLIVHVFGQGLDADTLRDAIEQDHLVELPDEGTAPATTTPTTVPTTIDPGRAVDMSGDVTGTSISFHRPPAGNESYTSVSRYLDGATTVHEFRYGGQSGRSVAHWDGDPVIHVPTCTPYAPGGRFTTVVLGYGVDPNLSSDAPVEAHGEDLGLTWCTTAEWSAFFVPIPDGARINFDSTSSASQAVLRIVPG